MSSDFYEDCEVFARKEHRCDECGGKINKGEKYGKQTGVSNGDFYTWKAHLDCKAVVIELHRIRQEASYEPLCHLYDFEEEDRGWVKEKHPAVYAKAFAKFYTTKDGERG